LGFKEQKMQWLVSGVALLAYGWSAKRHYLRLKQTTPSSIKIATLLAIFALILHGYLLHHWIDVGRGQDLTFGNTISLLLWISALTVVVGSWHPVVANYALVIFPLSALSIAFCELFPGSHILYTAEHPSELLHILFALGTVGVLALSGMQALLIMMQEYSLRKKKLFFWWSKLPALQTMELLLFRFLWLGFVALTGLLLTSFMTMDPWSSSKLIVKTLLSLLSWFIFCILLIGRYRFGWRGIQAARYVFGGIILVFLCSFLLTLSI
jgi:ABC-type uncharacterized transport system permease subunit